MKKVTWAIVCLLIVTCVIVLCSFESMQAFFLTKSPNEIAADTVVMLHSSNGDVSAQQVLITDKDTVSELLSLHNSLKVMYMSRPIAEERMWVIFYKENEITAEWCISFYREDGAHITVSDAFADRGNHVVKSEFDYARLVEIFNAATT